jgi:peptide-methionine (S)-S-oxide reductase
MSHRSLNMTDSIAIFAGGCFWCTEAVFKSLRGVGAVESGYIGGHVENPTQLNRQGNDIGTQYRSAIFPLNDAQEAEARAAIARAATDWPAPIVTSIEPPATWYPAEDYHQDYWDGAGQRNGYCLAVIPPKLAKLRKGFADRIS